MIWLSQIWHLTLRKHHHPPLFNNFNTIGLHTSSVITVQTVPWLISDWLFQSLVEIWTRTLSTGLTTFSIFTTPWIVRADTLTLTDQKNIRCFTRPISQTLNLTSTAKTTFWGKSRIMSSTITTTTFFKTPTSCTTNLSRCGHRPVAAVTRLSKLHNLESLLEMLVPCS